MTIPIATAGDDSDESIMLAIGTYLVYRGPESYFYVPAYRDSRVSYGAPAPWNDLQNIEIGQPVGVYYRDENVYKRNYEKAIVVVNPHDTEQSANIDKDYRGVRGNRVPADFMMQPHTAEIFLLE